MTEPRFYIWQTPPPGHALLRWQAFRPLHILNAWRAEWSYPRGYSGPRVEGAAPHPKLLAQAWVHRQQHYRVSVGTHGPRWGGLYVFGLGVSRDSEAIWSPSGPLRGAAGALMRHHADALSASEDADLPVLPGSPPGSRVEWREQTIWTAEGRAAVRPWAETFAAALAEECGLARVPMPEALVWDWEDHVLPWWAVRRNTAEYGGVQTGNIHAQRLNPRAGSEIVARGLSLAGLFESEPIAYDGSMWHLDGPGWRTWDSWLHEAASEAIWHAVMRPIVEVCGVAETSNWDHAAVRPGSHIDTGSQYPFMTRAPTYCRESMRTLSAYPVRRLRTASDPDAPLTPWAAHHAANLDALDDPSRALIWITAHDWAGYDGEWTRPQWHMPSLDDQRALAAAAASRGVRRVVLWFEDRRGWSAEPWEQAEEIMRAWADAWGIGTGPPPPPQDPARRRLAPGDVIVLCDDPRLPCRCWKLTDEVRTRAKIISTGDPGPIIDALSVRCAEVASSCEDRRCCERGEYAIGVLCPCSPPRKTGDRTVIWRRDDLLAALAAAGMSCVVRPYTDGRCYVWSAASPTISLASVDPSRYSLEGGSISPAQSRTCCGCCGAPCTHVRETLAALRAECESVRAAYAGCETASVTVNCSLADTLECCVNPGDRICWESVYEMRGVDPFEPPGTPPSRYLVHRFLACHVCGEDPPMQTVHYLRVDRGAVVRDERVTEPLPLSDLGCSPTTLLRPVPDAPPVPCPSDPLRLEYELSIEYLSCGTYAYRRFHRLRNLKNGNEITHTARSWSYRVSASVPCTHGCPESAGGRGVTIDPAVMVFGPG